MVTLGGCTSAASSRLTDPGSDSKLLSLALALPFGFAGFNAPACLTLAEGIEIVTQDAEGANRALHSARASAHNIQDGTFCARTTARVNAMMERWWGTGLQQLDVGALARDLLNDPSSPRFSAVHVIGEQYSLRGPAPTPLPIELLEARSLAALADAFGRPLADFVRLNADRGWSPDQQLPHARAVNVPDPGFPPLIAARLSARALADPALSRPQKAQVIRSLVPIAADELTTLHTVLARLALAWQPDDPVALDQLVGLAASVAEQQSPDTELAGRLTSYVP